MKHGTKKLAAILTAAALVLGLAPVTAQAQHPTSNLEVNGVNVFTEDPHPDFQIELWGGDSSVYVVVLLTDDAVLTTNGQVETTIGGIAIATNSGSVDSLTLDNVNIGWLDLYSEVTDSFTVTLRGTNVLTSDWDDALYCSGDLSIQGEGSGASLSLSGQYDEEDEDWYDALEGNASVSVSNLAAFLIQGNIDSDSSLTLTDITSCQVNGTVYSEDDFILENLSSCQIVGGLFSQGRLLARDAGELDIQSHVLAVTSASFLGNTYGTIRLTGAFDENITLGVGAIGKASENDMGFIADLDPGCTLTISSAEEAGTAIISDAGFSLADLTLITTPSNGKVAEIELLGDTYNTIVDGNGNPAPVVVLTGVSSQLDTGREYLLTPVTGTSSNETAPTNSTTPTNTTANVTEPEALAHDAFLFGLEDGTFQPEANLTRGQAASIFAQFIQDRTVESATSAFPDVVGKWYAPYVDFLNEKGILADQQTETFRGDDAITRAEFFNLAAKYFGWSAAAETTNVFTDVTETTPYYASILAAYSVGLAAGDGDGAFRPDAPITRQEAASLLNRAQDRQPDKDYIIANLANLKTFTDVTVYDEATGTGNWGYWDILEAANSHQYTLNAETGAEVWVALP